MPNYILWYQKRVAAKNIKEAIRKESKITAEFYSLEELRESNDELTPAIGFEIDYPWSEYENEEYESKHRNNTNKNSSNNSRLFKNNLKLQKNRKISRRQ